jgi:hypothetical protein
VPSRRHSQLFSIARSLRDGSWRARFSFRPYFFTSYFASAHTSSVELKGSHSFARSALFKNPGRNRRSRCFGFRTRRPIGLSVQEVPVNYTIPGAFFCENIVQVTGLRCPCSRAFSELTTVSPPSKNALATNGVGSKRLRRRFSYSRVNKQSTRPNRLGAVPTWLLSSCVIFALHAQ